MIDNGIIWNNWAKFGIEIFPYLKRKDSIYEVKGIQEMLKIKSPRAKILDLCCGWGRHCFELSKRGFTNVYGVDISDSFIKYAKNKNKNNGVKKFINEDFMDLNLKERFDIVISLWHSIGLYRKRSMNLLHLRKIYNFLKPSGKALIDVANGDRDLNRIEHLNNNFSFPTTKNWWYLSDTDTLALVEVNPQPENTNLNLIYHFCIFNYVKEKAYTEKVYQRRGKKFYFDDFIPGNKNWKYIGNNIKLSELQIRRGANKIKEREIFLTSREEPSKVRVFLREYTNEVLISMLKTVGFKIERIYGDFGLSEYSLQSPRLIIIAQKPNNKT